MNLVFLFSGQGSQKPGMGADLMGVPEVASSFECASDVLGYDLADLVATASPEKLNDTRYAQPALCVLSVGIARALIARGVVPAAVLGFSLGQVSALAVSGMLSEEETYRFVKARAEFMAEAASAHAGAMSALLKADDEAVRTVCESCAQGDVLVPANYNSPGQIVISGTPDAVARAEEAWLLRASVSRALPRRAPSTARLWPTRPKSSPSTWRVLSSASLPSRLSAMSMRRRFPLPAPASISRSTLRIRVRFQQSVEALEEQGHTTFWEVGFGGVLENLVKRIDRKAVRACVQDRASFDAALESLAPDAS